MKKFPYMRAINARLADVSETTSKLSLQEKQSLLSSLELDVAVIESFICRPRKTRRHTCFIIDTNAAGTGSVTTSIKLPKTMHVDGMPTEFYTVSVTPSQPVIASVSDQDKNGFIVTLTAPNGGAIAEGVLSILAIG